MYYRNMIFLLIALFAWSGCKEPQEPMAEKPHKPVVTFNFAKLNKDTTHKIPSNHLRGVVSSVNGEFVYVVGDKKASLMGLDVEKGLWDQALGDWKTVKRAANRSAVDLSGEGVAGFETFAEGLIFTVTGNQGMVVLKGVGVDNASLYQQNANNFPNGAFTPFIVTKNDNSHFIYLLAGRNNPVIKKSVLFRTYVVPPKKDDDAAPAWDNTLVAKSAPKIHLDASYLARVQDHANNLLLADKNGIKRINEADLGVTGKALDNNGQSVYNVDDFMLDKKTANTHINTLDLVDKKFLVVGLQSTDPNNGGLAIANISEAKPVWQHFGKGLSISVDFISHERIKKPERTNLAAVIATNKGLLLMDNEGKIMEIPGGKGHLITAKSINDHRAETVDYDKAHDGFTGDRVPETVTSYLGGGQDRNGSWYLGFKGKTDDDGGIYKFDVRIEQVESGAPPPVLP